MKFRRPVCNWQRYKFGTISLCMIMRDNAKTLGRCLESVRGLYDELVIVDTGSKDNSVDIARAYGAKVFFDPWRDDFARPRNIGIKKATCQWILVLDPDEMLLKKDHQDVRWLTRSKNCVAFWLTTLNYSGPTGEAEYKRCKEIKDPLGKYPGYTPSTKTRFFKNGLGIQFEGCWHELADWYCIRNKLSIGQATIPVHHWAHEITQNSRDEKRRFYLRMGEKKVREAPLMAKAWWELAVAEMVSGLRIRASHSIAQAIRLKYACKEQYFALAKCQRLLGNAKKRDLAFEKGVCKIYPMLTHIDPEMRTDNILIADL